MLLRYWPWLLGLVCAVFVCGPVSGQAADLCAVKTPAGRQLLEPSPASLPGANTYVYKTASGRPLRLYAFQPPGPPKAARSAIVMLYGGGWMFGNVKSFVPQAHYFSRRGAVVVLVDYRVFCRERVNITDEIKDAKAAVRWVRSRAQQLHVSSDRIAVFGGSAGGHLALSTAMFDNIDDADAKRELSAHPNLLVLFFPCVDETSQEEAMSAQAIQTYGKAVSPTLHVLPGLPAMLVVQGTADPLYRENKVYCAKVNAVGDSCSFVEFQGAPHGFGSVDKAYADGGLLEMDGFLTAHHYLPPRSGGSYVPR
jgi:acetyl esterase